MSVLIPQVGCVFACVRGWMVVVVVVVHETYMLSCLWVNQNVCSLLVVLSNEELCFCQLSTVI